MCERDDDRVLNVFLTRFVTACCVMDYNTVATADKFGNIAVVSLCEWACMFTNYVCLMYVNRPDFPLTHQMK